MSRHIRGIFAVAVIVGYDDEVKEFLITFSTRIFDILEIGIVLAGRRIPNCKMPISRIVGSLVDRLLRKSFTITPSS